MAVARATRQQKATSVCGEQGRESYTKKKPLKGGGEKEHRQYEQIKKTAEKNGRYGARAEEAVSARIVMKQQKGQIGCVK